MSSSSSVSSSGRLLGTMCGAAPTVRRLCAVQQGGAPPQSGGGVTGSARAVADTHRVTNHAVARLAQPGIVEEVTGRNDNRVFQAPAVLDILF